MKKSLFLVLGLSLLAGCGTTSSKPVVQENQQTSVIASSSSSYQVLNISQASGTRTNLDAIVVSSNIKNIVTTKSGILNSLTCTPGASVGANDIVATIIPDKNDPTILNASIQKTYLAAQIGNLQSMKNSAIASTNSQINLLNSQKGSTQGQIDILKNSIKNLEKQKNSTSGDLNIQIATLQDQKKLLTQQSDKIQEQIKILEDSKKNLGSSKSKDIEKINTNIANSKQSIQNLVNDSMQKVDNIFGITPANEKKNDSFENYLSAKDPSLKLGLDTQLYSVKSDLDIFTGLDNSQISALLEKTANLLKQSSLSVNASIASPIFPQTQIDGLYGQLYGALNNVLSAKTNFDTAFLSTTTTDNTYTNQINQIDTNISTLQSSLANLQNNILATDRNIQNIQENKGVSADIQIDNSINNIQSQILTTQTSLNNIQTQIDSANQNKNIQANQYDNQILGLQQNLKTIDTSLNGETIRSGINGIVKAKKGDVGNKLTPGTLICQISPKDNASYKLQISSPKNLSLGTSFSATIGGKIYSGNIDFQLPYTDSVTQMKIYEAIIPGGYSISEGEKITVSLLDSPSSSLWIPIEYIFPKLDGNYIKTFSGTEVVDKKIEIGKTNGNQIEILSGIKIGDKIAR